MFVKTSFIFEPLEVVFTVRHASWVDLSTLFKQFPSKIQKFSDYREDCTLHISENVLEHVDQARSGVYPMLQSDSPLCANGKSFFSYFDMSKVNWYSDGTSEVFIDRLCYSDSRLYLQNLLLKAFRHALLSKGFLVLHSSQCSYHNNGVLVIGAQNTGKSSFSVLTGMLGGSVISDDMVIVGQMNNSIIGRAAREKIALRETMIKNLFSEQLSHFKKSIFQPSGEVKYLLPRRNGLIDTKLYGPINYIFIANATDAVVDVNDLVELKKQQSLRLLINDICGQYDSPIFKFPSNMEKILVGIKMLNGLPVFDYRKSTKFLQNPVKYTQQCLNSICA